MSIVILKRHFEVVPQSADIMEILLGKDSGNRDNAKDALANILAPIKDLMDLLSLVGTMKVTAEHHVELLKEQEALTTEVATIKAALVSAKGDFDSATKIQGAALAKVTADTSKQIASLAAQVSKLEIRKADLAKGIEDEQTAQLRLNAAVSTEYDRLRAEMLAKVANDEEVARENLAAIIAKITEAQDSHDALLEKYRLFRASVGL